MSLMTAGGLRSKRHARPQTSFSRISFACAHVENLMCTGHLHRKGIFGVAANQITIGEIDAMATIWNACRN